ncbi:MAG: hypothetical protein WDM89_03790 [Rhizomicrobium sp.]
MKTVRLLPAVMIAGTLLLGLKGFGLVQGAFAQTKGGVQFAANLPAAKDVASDDNEDASPSETDVLTSLAKRRAELDARARDEQMRESVLAATEKRVDAKIAALKALQTQMTTLIGQRDAAQEKQVTSLVKTYSAMKPKDAARIFDGLSDDVLMPVAQGMKSDALAPVLAAMTPPAAQRLTVRLASRLNMPEKASIATTTVAAPAIASVAAPAAPGPQTQAAAATPAPAPAEAAKVPGPQAQAPQAAPPKTAAPQAAAGAHG